MDNTMVMFILMKTVVSTGIIYLSVTLLSRGNHRNTVFNALIATAVLTVLGYVPLIYLVGLLIWLYILMNWYNIGFIKSFLLVGVYSVFMLAIHVLLSATLLGATITVPGLIGVEFTKGQWEDFKKDIASRAETYYKSMLKKMGVKVKKEVEILKKRQQEKSRVIFTSGREVEARVLAETEEGYLLELADGRAEIMVRKKDVKSVEDHSEAPLPEEIE